MRKMTKRGKTKRTMVRVSTSRITCHEFADIPFNVLYIYANIDSFENGMIIS